MSFKAFLSARVLTLCFLGLGGLLGAVLLLFAQADLWLVATLGLLYLLLVALWLVCDYFSFKRRLHRLERQIDQLDEKYLLGELLEAPRDITEQLYFRALEVISHAAITAVEGARRDKEAYLNYVEQWIHEIKTPLTACSLILANGGDRRKLQQELKRADNLTENILYFARLRSADKDRQIQPVQAAAVIDQAVKSQMELLIAAGISVDVQGDFPLDTDSKALCFVLKQFLVNSAKYCPGCHIVIRACDGEITLEDNGIGIPPQELPRVWDRGFTGTNGRRMGDSTGMGLYLVHALCSQLNIGLDIASQPGAFTKITLRFAR